MEIDYIEDFLEVVASKSYNKAAINQNISTPGIKKRITQIETYFGYKLFNATHQGVQLTRDGVKLYERLKSIKQQIDDLKNTEQSLLKVGIISNFPLDKLSEMNKQTERIRLIPANSTTALLAQLQQDDIDLVIGEQTELQEGICYEYWFDEPFELVFSKNHPLAQSETINLNDLQQQHFYLLEPPGDTFDFKKNQIDPKQMDLSYVKDRESIMNFIATSDSVAICPQSYMKKVNSDIYTHIQLPNASRTIGIYAKKQYHIDNFFNILQISK
ncbi:LysR family transcriptional regulator [Staphylococcus saprophyticus]|uniref:LysR family transcriptional regulator n=3 Tax=Staphylococcus TaxID=1279 RepID=UPI00398AAC69